MFDPCIESMESETIQRLSRQVHLASAEAHRVRAACAGGVQSSTRANDGRTRIQITSIQLVRKK